MCLIIQRPANAPLDFEKFKTAVQNNPHGYGLSVPDGEGKLLTIRDHKTPDIDSLYKFVTEEFKEQKVMLHLRYTTVGKTILRNAHPFPVLEKSTDGVDLRMAHNGTLYSWKGNTDESDTRRFVKGFVRPLFKRLIKGRTSTELLSDPFVHWLLDDKLTQLSVITFIDGLGNTLEVNAKGNGGFYDDNGVYYSNTYSFNEDHRKPKNSVVKYGQYWSDDGEYVGQGSSYQTQQKKTETTTQEKPKARIVHAEDTQVTKFSEKYEIQPEYFSLMSDDFIEDLVANDGDGAVLLIKELLYELQMAEYEAEDAQ